MGIEDCYLDVSAPENRELLESLLRNKALDSRAVGVLKKVLAEGESDLSGKQCYVFRSYVVEEFVAPPIECMRCCREIPWRLRSDGGTDSYCNGCWEGMNED